MTYLVPRTCAVIGEDDSRDDPENASRPLEYFREKDAYVLLGAPGAGKTEAFKLEAERSGGCCVTARDFITFDDKPEWRSTNLFIDGLDEARAGSSDGRTPFDRIRAKLERLGRPLFRLSCREADWFGATDRECLQTVSRDGKVTVLHLNPISENDVREILRLNFAIEDTDGFVASARQSGIDTLLANPQSLRMLAKAITADGIWPDTRLKTFDLACQTLLGEFNTTHGIANRDRFDIPNLMDAAGRLCAVQLLTGGAGYTGRGGESDRDYPGLEMTPGEDREILRQALGTRVFESPDECRAAPVHRQVAEFLGARYLSGLIRDGLPAGRILALMTGHDGVVVSELRGLAAWLAAHGKSSREEIIARDPLGTVLYGDARGFSTDEKRQVLTGLEREAKRNPWFVRTIEMDSRLGDIVTPGMEAHFREILADPARDDARQSFVLIVVEMLVHGQALPKLADLMMEVLTDEAWWPRIKHSAVKAFIRHRGYNGKAFAELKELTADVYADRVPDPEDDLLGCLLNTLYPGALSAQEVLKYLRVSKSPSYCPRYEYFWNGQLPKNSTPVQLAQLLDDLVARYDQLRAEVQKNRRPIVFLHRVPLVLLRRFLETSQEEVDTKRLFDWLGVAAWADAWQYSDIGIGADETDRIGSWLSSRSELQKSLIVIGLERCLQSPECNTANGYEKCMTEVRRRLFDATPPPDFGSWCLNRAIAAEDRSTANWFMGKVADFVHDRRHDEGLSRETVERRLVGKASLLRLFDKRLTELEGYGAQNRHFEQRQQSENRQRQREWREILTSEEAALRENQGAPALLDDLARAYYDEFIGVQGNTPADRLRDLVGGDEDLIAAILEGFRGAIRRSDAPTEAEILDLNARNRTHFLALPIIAGLDDAARIVPVADLFPDEKQIRLAIAIYFTSLRPVGAAWPPNWFSLLLTSHSGAVADVLIRSATSMMRGGADYVPGFHEILSEDHVAVARLATVPLLKAFPVRCTKRQLPNLKILFRAALLHCEKGSFLELINKKLAHRSMNVAQRVYWLTAGLSVWPQLYLNRLESYVGGSERRVRYLAEAFASLPRASIQRLDVPVLRILIRLIGGSCKPYSIDSLGATGTKPAMAAADCIRGSIDRLATTPSEAATEALEELSSDDNLRAWRSLLSDAAYRQNAARREAGFRHCDFGQVLDTLDNGKPANAADLAALSFEYLREISKNIRDGNTSDWRQYWNADSPHRTGNPRPEDLCRDALLSDLQNRLKPLDIDAQAEAHYADYKRSDIRVSFGGFNVPVEIKKSCHRDLWSAIGTQLIAKYTRDPGADGYGIYLVFWFGHTEHCRPTPGEGTPPKSAGELEERLRGTLSSEERHKISICVIDVAKPEA